MYTILLFSTLQIQSVNPESKDQKDFGWPVGLTDHQHRQQYSKITQTAHSNHNSNYSFLSTT